MIVGPKPYAALALREYRTPLGSEAPLIHRVIARDRRHRT
jgi:hypothetical protein